MRTVITMIGLISLAMFCGCAGTMPGPGQPTPGALFTANAIPGSIGIDAEYLANPDDFEILGLVEGTSGNSNILGLVSVGNGGYIAAMENAMSKVDADGLINCVADIKSTNVLFIFSSTKTVVRGLAIRKKK